MGVGPCEWSEVNTKAATTEGFVMNTLRRIPRIFIKTVAAGAVLVATALPVAVMGVGVASAATPPTLSCSIAAYYSSPTCSSGYAIIGQGFSGNFYLGGTGFAADQQLGGNVTLTTTAPGVSFTNVQEDSSGTFVTAEISSTSATPTGFFPVTLTDDNGSSTMTLGLGIDNGPQITSVIGNAGTAGGAASTVTVTGTNLQFSDVEFDGNVGSPVVVTENTSSDTSITFTVDNSDGSTVVPGTYAFTITGGWPFPAYGSATGSYTVNAAATPITITGVTPNELGIPASGTSTVTATVTGTGFESGATLSIAAPAGTSEVTSTFVNSTTMTLTLDVAAGATTGQVDITVHNPDSNTLLGTGLIGIGVPAASLTAGSTPPVAPVILTEAGSLTPGTSAVVFIQGSSSFPLTTGTTISVTGHGQTVAGQVLSVDGTNTARVLVNVPRFATTTLTAASTLTSTSLSVASVTGMPASGNVIISDGANSQTVAYSAIVGNNLTISAGAASAHAAGLTVEFPFPPAADYVLSANNGTYTESTAVTINADPATAYLAEPSMTALPTGLIPGTYSVNAYVPGFGFTTGAAVFFGNTGPTVQNGITGTVTAVNGNTATLAVTVPAVETSLNSYALNTAATPGQNALSLATNAGLAVGNKITVNADPFYLTPETFTVTSVDGGGHIVGVSPAVADNHSSGATVSDLSSPQATTGTVSAVITNGAGQAVTIADFFGLTTPGTITGYSLSTNGVGAGASAAAIVFTTSSATGGSDAAWTVTSTTTGVTFGTVTDDTGSTITTTISVAPGTAASASVPVSITNGIKTFTGTIAVVPGPTVTAITTVATLTAGGSEVVGVTGTNLVGSMTCATSDPAVTCTETPNVATDSSTTRTVTINVGAAALNGTDSLTLTDPNTFGAGTLATAVKVSGQPVATAISPTIVPEFSSTLLTVTGTGIPSNLSTCSYEIYNSLDVGVYGNNCATTYVSATSATITAGSYNTSFGGDTIIFTLGNGTSTFDTPAVTVQVDPFALFYVWNGNFSPNIAAGSANVPVKIIGFGFGPGATVTIPAADGTFTETSVTPNAIYGTVSFLNSVQPGPYGPDADVTATITNTNGGAGSVTFFVSAAPTVNAIGGVAPAAVLEATGTKLVITGTHFVAGATVTLTNAALGTFGTAVVTSSTVPLSTCTTYADNCDTITVTVTPLNFTGNTPIVTGIVVTNPVGDGSVSDANSLTINPVPVVTGTYNVATFSTNLEVTITGTGFQAGMTASATNSPAYTVTLVSVNATGTAAVLLVTTTSAATTGTFSTVTFTNPDGGSVSFPLNGGPAPLPQLHITGIHGRPARIGRTVTFTILGSNLGKASVTVHHRGVSVHKTFNSNTVIKVKVTVKRGTKSGVAKLHVFNANGSAMVAFSIKK